MTETEKTPTILQALANVMKDITAIGKKDFNDFHGFAFRGYDLVMEYVGPAFRKHGIVPIPEVREIRSDDLTAKSGNRKRGVTLTVAYTFYGPAGDSITTVVPGEANDTEDKASSKAMSVAFRTALLQVLAIPTGERDPHAGPRISAKLAALREKAKKFAADKGWTFEELRADYTNWSGDGLIEEADEAELEKYLNTVNPPATKTMQRRQPQGGQR